MNKVESLERKISDGTVTLGVLGLGYVGLPLAVCFAKQGIRTVGFEKSHRKIEKLRKGENYIDDVEDATLSAVVASGVFTATDDFSKIRDCDAIMICVPTPLDEFREPDMSYIRGACEEIGHLMKPGTLVILESTTYPTTTEKFMLPVLEAESGMKQGDGFWLCYSPERVDPGNKTYKTENTPKVVGGIDPAGAELAASLYKKAVSDVHVVSSPRNAEMVKILENTYRLVNISLVNELALLCGKMDINIWEVIEAAKTKPYGFQAFYPGPGIGGHCIPLDPFYLEYIAKNYAFDLTMIHTAGQIDTLMPHRMTVKISSALNHHKKPLNGSKFLFLGVAYKPDIADERESPSLKIMKEIMRKKGDVRYHDPYIPELSLDTGTDLQSVTLDQALVKKMDCVVITTKHSCFDFGWLQARAPLIVDLVNAYPEETKKIYKL